LDTRRALIRSPNAPADKVAARACNLGRALKALDALAVNVRAALGPRFAVKPSQNLAPHVAEALLNPLRNSSGKKTLSVKSTLDGKLQRFAIDILQQHLLALKTQNVKDAVVLVVNNQSGEVLAYVDNSDIAASARCVKPARR
jgi:penicillin-binding protein 1C